MIRTQQSNMSCVTVYHVPLITSYASNRESNAEKDCMNYIIIYFMLNNER